MNILLLDICHTLYKSNTTFDFLDWYLKEDAEYQRIRKLRKNIIVRVLLKLSPTDFLRNKAVHCLKGESQDELLKAAHEFISDITPISEVFIALEDYRSRGYKIVLLSSSLDFIVEAVSKSVSAHTFYASKLEYIDNKCNGELNYDLLHRKSEIILENFPKEDCVFISDNRTDLDCVPLVQKFIAVFSKRDSSSASFWKKHGVHDELRYE